MGVELTGYSRQIDPSSGLQKGLDDLKKAGRDEARDHLKELRRDLQTKTGVVRLLHTSKTDRDMKFKNAGAFKRMFLSGEKLKRSGDVIADLLSNAGLPPAKVTEFKSYVQARGNKGVQAQKVLEYIDSLQADSGDSPQEALAKFGIDPENLGRSLGSGAFGEVHSVRYRGADHVYKTPKPKNPDSKKSDSKKSNPFTLKLADQNGNVLEPVERQDKRSFVTVASKDEGAGNQFTGLLGKPMPWADQKKVTPEVYDDDDTSSQDSDYSVKDFWKFMPGQILSNEFKWQDDKRPQDPGFNHLMPNAKQAGSKEVTTAHQPTPPKALIEEEPVQTHVEGQKLARTGLGVVSRVKDLPQVLTPSVYVVKEVRQGGADRFHAVGRGKTLKEWARTQDKDSQFEVVGLLMPKAAGKNPLEYSFKKAHKDDDGDTEYVKSNVSRSDLKPMAQSALNLIKGLAKHGFIHGDIKPENLFWDAKTKALQLIDNDGLRKVSKKAGSVVPKGLGSLSILYLNPVAYHEKFRYPAGGPGENAQLGLGRDLYAMGLVMLEASLLAEGMSGEDVQRVMQSITYGNLPFEKIKLFLATKPIEDRIKVLNDIEGMKAGGVAEFARKCVIKALEFERERVDPKEESKSVDRSEGRQNVSAKTKSYTFDRSDTGPEAKLLQELQEDLDRVQ